MLTNKAVKFDLSMVAVVVVGGDLLDDAEASCTLYLQILRVHGLLQIPRRRIPVSRGGRNRRRRRRQPRRQLLPWLLAARHRRRNALVASAA
jgi:hypothetical protein